jgi:sugar phosphate isomerase/epimerase
MNTISRRDFIRISCGSMAAFSLAGLTGCGTRADAHTPLGVQLYSVRHQLDDDFEGTIAQLAEMGFEGVEFADYHGLTATEIREILDRYNLRCCGNHVMLDVLREESFEETIELNQELGNNYFIIRWIPEGDRNNRDTFMRTIDEYNETTERLAAYDMQLGYHNHDYIFEQFDGDYLWDILAENTDDRFILQLDTGHAALMGEDPVELIHRHPGRTASIHAKAYSTVNEEAVIGEDQLDWAGIIEASETVGGIEWYILEYEIENVDPIEALEACINNFKAIQRG